MRVGDRAGGPVGESREKTQVEAAFSIRSGRLCLSPTTPRNMTIWEVAIAAAVVASWPSRGTSSINLQSACWRRWFVCSSFDAIEIAFRLLGALYSLQAPRDVDGAAPSRGRGRRRDNAAPLIICIILAIVVAGSTERVRGRI